MSKNITIGMLTARFFPVQGGAEIQCRRLSARLKGSGCGILIITQKIPGSPRFETIENLNVYRLGIPLSNILGSLAYFVSALKFILKRFSEIDVLHAHIASAPAVAACLATKLWGKPSVVKFAGSRNTGDIATSLKTPYGKLKLGFIRDNLSAAVCPSGEIAAELEKYGFETRKIRVIPNGIDVKTFAPLEPERKAALRRELGLPEQGKIVLYSGRLEKGKGLDNLIEAWKRIESGAITPSAHLAIIGSGKLLGTLTEQAAGLKTAGFYSWKDNVNDYMKASDIFVLPSLGEGMPNSLLEAMASGLACVSTEIGGITELITNNVSGLLYRPGDAGALTENLKRLLLDAELSGRLAKNARETAVNNYSIEKTAEAYIKLYNEVLEGAPKAV